MLGDKFDIDSRVFANHLIKEHFHNHYLPKGDCMQQVSGILRSFAFACDEALNDLDGLMTQVFEKVIVGMDGFGN